MRKLQEGDVLKKEDRPNKKILAVCGDLVAHLNDGENCVKWILPCVFEENGWKLEEPKWKPEEDEDYYYPEPTRERLYGKTIFKSNYQDDWHRLGRGLIFKTQKEAIEKAKSMLEK